MSAKRYLPDTKVCERYGVSDTTLDRWDLDPNLNFPKPLVIRKRKYRDLDELEDFEASKREDPQVTAWEPRGDD